jgi:hypothetical protein
MSDTDTEQITTRFLEGIGLAECSLFDSARKMSSFRCGLASHFVGVRKVENCDEALRFLSKLTFPATRHVLFAANERITAFINNSRNGSDYGDYIYHIPRHLNCRFVRFVQSEQRVWTNGTQREIMRYGARIFQLDDSKGQTIRSVTCANDGGRWVFESHGIEHPIESTFPYAVKRKKDRFTVSHLHQLTQAFGFTVPDAKRFQEAGEYHLFHEQYEHDAKIIVCTIEEADDPAYGYFLRGMGYVNHMKTHATSVIADFEKCVQFNPEYEPKVREYLAEARRQLAKDVDDKKTTP